MPRVRRSGWPTRPEAGADTAELVEEAPAGPPPLPPADLPPEREIWPWLLVLLVLVLAGLGAAYLLTRDGDASAGATTASATLTRTVAQTTVAAPKPVAARVTVPRLVGLPAPTALRTLQKLGLTGTSRSVFSTKPPNRVVSQQPGASRKVVEGSIVSLNVSKGPKAVPVPDVVGQSVAGALATIEAQDFTANVARVPSDQQAGRVVAQHPKAGAKEPTGSGIRLNVSDGTRAVTTAPAPAKTTQTPSRGTTTAPALATASVTVPDVTGETLADARAELRRIGLVIEIRRVPSSQPRDTIVAQARKPGTSAKRRDHLLVTVSLGPKRASSESISVPSVVGEDQAAATQDLENAGLVVRAIDHDTADPAEDGVVIDQTPAASQPASAESTVTIYVGRYSG